jgi:hypothetical protein
MIKKLALDELENLLEHSSASVLQYIYSICVDTRCQAKVRVCVEYVQVIRTKNPSRKFSFPRFDEPIANLLII